MSGDERSDSHSDEDDIGTTGLIATRAKRSTAGNLYATLRQNLDDEELQKELLAEDEEDAGDYEGSDRDGDDDDEAMDSSSDEEDAGPPKGGEAEELDGEKELKRAERAEAKKRKRMDAARMRIPGWQKRNKRVKLAEDAKANDGNSEKVKKKQDRPAWLLGDFDAPIRQSSRSSAVQSREMTHASLKQSAERSENQKRRIERAHERERLRHRTDLSQEDRLAKALKVEKETAREFGRWEREEAERQRIREEQLAAKRKRDIEGPVQRFWSGSVLWEGDHIKIQRMHRHGEPEEIPEPKEENMPDIAKHDEEAETEQVATTETSQNVPSNVSDVVMGVVPDPTATAKADPSPGGPTAVPGDNVQMATSEPPTAADTHSLQPSQPLLDGIHAYASQNEHPDAALPETSAPRLKPYLPSAPGLATDVVTQDNVQTVTWFSASAGRVFSLPTAEQSNFMANPRWPIYQSMTMNVTQEPQEQLPCEQAQRTLLVLENYESLDATTTSKRATAKAAKDIVPGPTPLAATLAPIAYPSFTPEESRYLTAKMRKRGAEQLLPPPPAKTKCSLTCWPAKFRDPKTGLPYADLQTYKLIQRVLAGGCAWSGLVGAWVGPTYGEMGRPARGVPEGFGVSPPAKTASPTTTVKIEASSSGD